MNLRQCMPFEYFIYSLTTGIRNSCNLTYESNIKQVNVGIYYEHHHKDLRKERITVHINLVYKKKQEVS